MGSSETLTVLFGNAITMGLRYCFDFEPIFECVACLGRKRFQNESCSPLKIEDFYTNFSLIG